MKLNSLVNNAILTADLRLGEIKSNFMKVATAAKEED
jgi:hypothetical protein